MKKAVNSQQLVFLQFTEEKQEDDLLNSNTFNSHTKDSINKWLFQLSPTTKHKSPCNNKNLQISSIKKQGRNWLNCSSTNIQSSRRSGVSTIYHKPQQHPTTTSFNLLGAYPTLPAYSLKVALISISNYTFSINYSYDTSYRKLLSQQISEIDEQCCKLLARIKKVMVRQPLCLFNFYNEVLCGYSQQKLRQFLIRNKVKYSSCEIMIFQKLLDILLDYEKPEGILQFLFLNKKEDDQFIISFNMSLSDKIVVNQSNFWKALRFLFIDGKARHNQAHSKSIIGYELHQISYFLRQLL